MKKTERYARQLAIPEIGEAGQKKLKASKVLIIGAGGLGSPAALYLAAAGVGSLGIIDYDTVGLSNLNRQILYEERDLGKMKCEAAAERIKSFNSGIEVAAYAERIGCNNLTRIREIIACYDIVIDACDNMTTRYLVSDITAELSIPFVYGAIEGFCGYVSVFNAPYSKKRLRDLWPEERDGHPQEIPSIGFTTGTIGALQVNEAIKLICGYGESLAGKLLAVDLCKMTFNIISF